MDPKYLPPASPNNDRKQTHGSACAMVTAGVARTHAAAAKSGAKKGNLLGGVPGGAMARAGRRRKPATVGDHMPPLVTS